MLGAVTDAYEKWAKKKDLFNSFIFMNDADDTQHLFASYSATNMRALKKIRAKHVRSDGRVPEIVAWGIGVLR